MCSRSRFSLGFAVLLTACFGGCATRGAYDTAFRASNNFEVYDMYDNSRDWGPSYLVGAPDHHLGYGSRIGDSRATPPQQSQTPPMPTYSFPALPPLP